MPVPLNFRRKKGEIDSGTSGIAPWESGEGDAHASGVWIFGNPRCRSVDTCRGVGLGTPNRKPGAWARTSGTYCARPARRDARQDGAADNAGTGNRPEADSRSFWQANTKSRDKRSRSWLLHTFCMGSPSISRREPSKWQRKFQPSCGSNSASQRESPARRTLLSMACGLTFWFSRDPKPEV